MALAGSVGVLSTPGAAVPFTNEPCTVIAGTGNTQYRINTAARRVLDPAATVVVKDNAVTVTAGTYTVDFLFGTIIFQGAKTGPVTIDASYLPMLPVGEVASISIQCTRDILDASVLGQTARKKVAGLEEATGNFVIYASPNADLDGGAGTVSLQALSDAGTPLLLEAKVGTVAWRGWVLIESQGTDASADGLVEHTLNFTSHAKEIGAANAAGSVSFGFGTV